MFIGEFEKWPSVERKYERPRKAATPGMKSRNPKANPQNA